MTARVLVVDDVPANVRLLEARLTAEYFQVVTATNAHDAIDIASKGGCDIVLLDVMMPGLDGFEACRRLKAARATHHLPVVMVTALDEPEDRVRGLEAGADDFITKPVSDIALVTRVRSLSRLKLVIDELRMRVSSGRHLGIDDPLAAAIEVSGDNGRILIVDDYPGSYERLAAILGSRHEVELETDPQNAIFRVAEGNYDVVVASLALDGVDALRVCSQVRSIERTRNLPILLVAQPENTAPVLRGLDMGVNDYILRPIDRNELTARVATQVRRKRYTDQLRSNLQLSVTMALTDLHNRRYMETHLQTLIDQCRGRGKSLAVLLLDIDYFKAVNDSYGHDVGDDVLREFARRVRHAIRGIDLACRLGGEEFVIVMPETEVSIAMRVGERIRQAVAREPFVVGGGRNMIDMTVSVGVTTLSESGDTVELLLKRADQALYLAKREGRNRVIADAA